MVPNPDFADTSSCWRFVRIPQNLSRLKSIGPRLLHFALVKMKSSLVPAAVVAAAACAAGPASAFAPQVRSRSATALNFGKLDQRHILFGRT